ncbi:MAG TPA: hypothetical protein VFB26_03730 [Gaiellaceae bacterium]|nr:hypothetical protein [Gaiellaceae bacterium]
MRIAQLMPAEPGWKAVFGEPDGGESVSRILGWAVAGEGEEGEVVGVIVDPSEPSRIVPAPEATSPDGGEFVRYRFVPPEPIVVQAPAPAPPAKTEPDEPQTPEKIAKGFIKRKL